MKFRCTLTSSIHTNKRNRKFSFFFLLTSNQRLMITFVHSHCPRTHTRCGRVCSSNTLLSTSLVQAAKVVGDNIHSQSKLYALILLLNLPTDEIFFSSLSSLDHTHCFHTQTLNFTLLRNTVFVPYAFVWSVLFLNSQI